MNGERGERGGVVLDQGSEDEGLQPIEDVGAADVAITKDTKTNNVVDEQGGATDADGGTENFEVGENDQVQEGEVLEDGAKPGAPNDDRLGIVEKTLNEIRAKINEKPAEVPKALTEEEWSKHEQDWGVPRAAIERVTQQNVRVVNHLREYIDGELAKLRFDSAITDFSKTPGFNDAARYKKDVQEFLGSYEPRHWNNPDLLKKAVFYARGVNAQGTIQRVRADTERNRKIAGAARPASPGGSIRKGALPPLTPTQREAAMLMPGGEAEYNKFRVGGGRRVIE